MQSEYSQNSKNTLFKLSYANWLQPLSKPFHRLGSCGSGRREGRPLIGRSVVWSSAPPVSAFCSVLGQNTNPQIAPDSCADMHEWDVIEKALCNVN